MFIPPSNYKPAEKETGAKSQLQLKSSHLIIDHDIVQKIFGDGQNIYAVYYPKKQSLMLAPVSDELFKKLHKASQFMLKDKNLKGDKSIAIHEIIIDNQLDGSDRDLEFGLEAALGILTVKI